MSTTTQANTPKTKEEIYNLMVDEMPYELSEVHKRYILEAMELYLVRNQGRNNMESNMIPANYNHTKEQQWWDCIHNHAELCIKHNIKAATSCYTIPFSDVQKIYNLEHDGINNTDTRCKVTK